MIPKKYKIMEIQDESHDVKTFRVDFKGSYEPGQFFEIGLLGVGEAPISVSSDSKKYADFTIRNVGNVTNCLHKLKKGDAVWLRGPFGNSYPMKEMEGSPVVLIGGGCGVAPMASALEYIRNHRKKYGEIKTFFGFKCIDEILYKRRLKDYKEDFTMNISLDRQEKGWTGFVGYVTDLLKQNKIDKESYALICGPPAMISAVVSILTQKGVRADRILLSLERKMQCGLGKCGHCRMNEDYVCKDGPIFSYSKLKEKYD